MARPGRPKREVVLTEADAHVLEGYARRPRSSPNLARRARIVLGCAAGLDNKVIAKKVRVSPQTVSFWRGRFVRDGVDGLLDEPRPGAPSQVLLDSRTMASRPNPGAALWAGPTGPHYVENVGSAALHIIAVELKG